MSAFDYSTTPGANTSVDGINIAEGMPPGNVNNAMRAMMADTRKLQLDSGGFSVTSGSGNAYVYTASQEFTEYASGMRFTFRSDRANTGNATINISGKGSVQLRKFSAGSAVALDAGDIGQNEVIDIVYSAAIPAFVMIGKADVAENQVAMTGPGLVGRGLSGAGRSLRIGFGDGVALSGGNLIANLGAGLSFVSGAIVAAVSRIATQAEAQAGTSNIGAMTPLRVQQHTNATDIGWEQEWQIVSRVVNTNYRNTTGRPIMVSARGTGGMECRVGATEGNSIMVGNSANTGSQFQQFIVPNGHYYRFSGGSLADEVRELR